jgi:hypothetical protein
MSVVSVLLPTQFSKDTYFPAFDTTAALEANFVTGEIQKISENQGTDAQVIFPAYAPFYENDLVVSFIPDGGSSTTLTLGVDYVFAYPFISATRATGHTSYGGIALINNAIGGNVTINYRTIGGSWVYQADLQTSNLFSIYNDPYITAWEIYADYQQAFPVVNVPWDRADSASIQTLELTILDFCNSLTQSFLNQYQGFASAIAHVFNYNNPHATTAADIGLGSVANYPPATNAQASDPTNNSTYISPAQLPLAFANITPLATDTSAGVNQFTNASVSTDAASATKALTAGAFNAYAPSSGNDLGKAINHSQKTATFTNWPSAWPSTVHWMGNTYTTAESLMAAVQSYLKVSPLEYNKTTGQVWFPFTTTIPTMTLT